MTVTRPIRFCNQRFADGMNLIATPNREHQDRTSKLTVHMHLEWKRKWNGKKKDHGDCHCKVVIAMNVVQLKEVNSLEATIINWKLHAIALPVMVRLDTVYQRNNLRLTRKYKLYKSLVQPVLLNGVKGLL